MTDANFEANKMPLGKLSKETIKKGYQVLKQIEEVIKKNKKGDLLDLTS